MSKKRYHRPNPPDGATLIYGNLIQIKAEKSPDSLWPNELFKHDFEQASNACVYGLSNGCLLIIGDKPLWKHFGYEDYER
jgi:hypothetical protein